MKNIINSTLFNSTVLHKRLVPFKHHFKYSLLSFYIDYEELKFLDKKISFFSYNKFNFFSFYEKDHGYRDKRSLNKFVADILKKNSIKHKNINFKILCFPRILGYVFNPLSIIFCFNSKKLIAILYEVKNTSGEKHTYCFVDKNTASKSEYKHNCKKKFYVSPFIEMKCYYRFSIKIPSNSLFVLINQYNSKNQKILIASQIGKKISFTSATIIRYFLKNPLVTFKVILGIHYQAFKILFKGGRYYFRKKKPLDTISFEGRL